ncbi:MAG: T9SS type A sorting domain-containing protein [Bacteroidetes bacterium]|nr:T9SS type A sorting domain-containing protein [Bacteroidota bacterium]
MCIKSQIEIGSISMIIEIPVNCLVVNDVVANFEGTLVWHMDGNLLKIAWYSLKTVQLMPDDILLTLRCSVTSLEFIGFSQWSLDASSQITDGNTTAYEHINLSIPNLHWSQNQYYLSQNTPNPFSDYTDISYYLPEKGKVSLVITDLLGRTLLTAVDAVQDAGLKKEIIQLNSLAPGIYQYTLKVKGDTRDFSKTMQMIIEK